MNRIPLFVLPLSLVLASCGSNTDPSLDQTGPQPDLPEQNDALLPAMNVSPPGGWNGRHWCASKNFHVPALSGLRGTMG